MTMTWMRLWPLARARILCLGDCNGFANPVTVNCLAKRFGEEARARGSLGVILRGALGQVPGDLEGNLGGEGPESLRRSRLGLGRCFRESTGGQVWASQSQVLGILGGASSWWP